MTLLADVIRRQRIHSACSDKNIILFLLCPFFVLHLAFHSILLFLLFIFSPVCGPDYFVTREIKLTPFWAVCTRIYRSIGPILSSDKLERDTWQFLRSQGIGAAETNARIRFRLWFRCFLQSDRRLSRFSLLSANSLLRISASFSSACKWKSIAIGYGRSLRFHESLIICRTSREAFSPIFIEFSSFVFLTLQLSTTKI